MDFNLCILHIIVVNDIRLDDFKERVIGGTDERMLVLKVRSQKVKRKITCVIGCTCLGDCIFVCTHLIVCECLWGFFKTNVIFQLKKHFRSKTCKSIIAFFRLTKPSITCHSRLIWNSGCTNGKFSGAKLRQLPTASSSTPRKVVVCAGVSCMFARKLNSNISPNIAFFVCQNSLLKPFLAFNELVCSCCSATFQVQPWSATGWTIPFALSPTWPVLTDWKMWPPCPYVTGNDSSVGGKRLSFAFIY